jgi:hypothetical protein
MTTKKKESKKMPEAEPKLHTGDIELDIPVEHDGKIFKGVQNVNEDLAKILLEKEKELKEEQENK